MRSRLALGAALVACALAPRDAYGFPLIVKPGETLAQIAERIYGDARMETVVAGSNGLDAQGGSQIRAGSNGLDAQGGSQIRAGMRLEMPAPEHVRCAGGETYRDLALRFLGDAKRADILARFNAPNGNASGGAAGYANTSAPLAAGQEVAIPYVVTHVAADGDLLSSIARRYLRDAGHAAMLDAYNDMRGGNLHRGDVVLVPLTMLSLTERGRDEARQGHELARSQGTSALLEAQRRVESELPALLADVRGGRYVDVVARGNRLLGTADLPAPQLARIHRALLEAYVALDAPGAAAGACKALRSHESGLTLDPSKVSPKIRAACESK